MGHSLLMVKGLAELSEAMPYRATQDGQVAIVEGPDKTWSIGGGNCDPL